MNNPGLMKPLPILAALLLAATALGLSAFELHNNDIGYHITYGRYILEHGIPSENHFSSINQGYPIQDDKWLFQVGVALLDTAGGPTALCLLRMALVALLGLLILLLIREELPLDGPLPWLGACLALWAMSERFLLRPELLSYVLLAGMLWLLEQLRHDRGRAWPLLLLQVIWVNSHGYFILGPAMAGALMTAALLRGEAHRARAKRWALLTAGLVAACFVAPTGWRAAVYPVITLAELYTRRNRAWASIHEFKPSLAAEAFVTHTYVLYCALLAATPLAMAATWRRQATWYRPILLVAFIAMSLTIRRNIVLLGPVGCWLLVTAIGRLQWGNRTWRAAAWALLLLLGPTMLLQPVTDRLYLAEHRIRRFGLGLSGPAYPAAAVGYLRNSGLRGIYWNNFEIGSYLNWQLYPDKMAFLDGNLNAIPQRCQSDYMQLISGRLSIDAYVKKYGIRFWVIQHGPCDTLDLIGRLARSEKWSMSYLDDYTVIFESAGAPLTPPVVEPVATLPRPAPRAAYLLRKLLSLRRTSYPQKAVYRTSLYLELGWIGHARSSIGQALEACNWDPRVYHLAGLVQLMSAPQSAAWFFQSALQIKPNYAPSHFNLALLLGGDRGLDHYRAAFRTAPSQPRYAEGLITALLDRDLLSEADQISERAVKHVPGAYQNQRLRGIVLEQMGRRKEAVAHFRRSLDIRPNQPDILARIQKLEGN